MRIVIVTHVWHSRSNPSLLGPRTQQREIKKRKGYDGPQEVELLGIEAGIEKMGGGSESGPSGSLCYTDNLRQFSEAPRKGEVCIAYRKSESGDLRSKQAAYSTYERTDLGHSGCKGPTCVQCS